MSDLLIAKKKSAMEPGPGSQELDVNTATTSDMQNLRINDPGASNRIVAKNYQITEKELLQELPPEKLTRSNRLLANLLGSGVAAENVPGKSPEIKPPEKKAAETKDTTENKKNEKATKKDLQAEEKGKKVKTLEINKKDITGKKNDEKQEKVTTRFQKGVKQSKTRKKSRAKVKYGKELNTPEIEVENIALEPLYLMPAAPLLISSLSNPYTASRSINIQAFNERLKTDNATELQKNEAVELTRKEYSKFSLHTGQKYLASRNNRNRAIAHIHQEYLQSIERIQQITANIDARHEELFFNAELSINETAAYADEMIVNAYANARSSLAGTKGRVDALMDKNYNTAAAQITQIVESLTDSRIKIIDEAKSECVDNSVSALSELQQWQKALPTRNFSRGSAGTQPAENEAKRKAGKTLVQGAIDEVKTEKGNVEKAYEKIKLDVKKNIRYTVDPPDSENSLSKHAEKIKTHGKKSVNQTYQGSLRALRQQANDARLTGASLRKQYIEQLIVQRKSARASLEIQSANAMKSARQSTDRAYNKLYSSALHLLPLYADTAEKLRLILLDAAATGSASLNVAAKDMPGSLLQQILSADENQKKQVSAIVSGTLSGLNTGHTKLQENLDLQYAKLNDGVNLALQQAQQTMGETVQKMTENYPAYATRVSTAAKTWTTPLADLFAKDIKKVKDHMEPKKKDFKANIDKAKNKYINWANLHAKPDKLFKDSLFAAWLKVRLDLVNRKNALINALDYGIINTVDEGGATGALRGITYAQGLWMKANWIRAPEKMKFELALYHRKSSYELGKNWRAELPFSLDIHLAIKLDVGSNDHNAAKHYLIGETAQGAAYELKASVHWYNDEEKRIEETMRALNDEQLIELHRLAPDVIEDTRDALGGVDRDVFDEFDVELVLVNGRREYVVDPKRFEYADMRRMLPKIDAARRRGDSEAATKVLSEYYKAADPKLYGGQEVSEEQRRRSLNQAFVDIKGVDIEAVKEKHTKAKTPEQINAYALFDYVSRDIKRHRHQHGAHAHDRAGYGSHRGRRRPIILKMDDAQKKLAEIIILKGENTLEGKAAALVAEAKRPGGPKMENIARLLYDERLAPDKKFANEKEREEARNAVMKDRAKLAMLFADYGYGKSMDANKPEDALKFMEQTITAAYKSNDLAKEVASGLIKQPSLTPEIAAKAMEYSIKGAGTNKKLIDQILSQMNRDQIQDMRTFYWRNTKSTLYADLGVYGYGTFGDLSGDDRLDVQLKLLGVPRNDKERAEVAAYKMHLQRKEASSFGKWLASGSTREQYFMEEESNLKTKIGGKLIFSSDGRPIWLEPGNFDKGGKYTGDDAVEFSAALSGAKLAAQSYAAKIDQYANFAANTIAVIGAIALTVATGGSAGPLVLAAIAAAAGGATMLAKTSIKGGRYGWEEAAADLGSTAVEALTAGVGAKLSLMSRGLKSAKHVRQVAKIKAANEVLKKAGKKAVTLPVGKGGIPIGEVGHLTGSAFKDKLVQGVGMGAMGSFGQTAIAEKTWEKGLGKGFENLFLGTVKGGFTGGVNTSTSSLLEALPIIKNMNPILLEGLSSGMGDFTATSSGLYFDRFRGEFKGDAGDIFVKSVEEGAKGAVPAMAGALSSARYQNGLVKAAAEAQDISPAEVPDAPAGTKARAKARTVSDVETQKAATKVPEPPDLKSMLPPGTEVTPEISKAARPKEVAPEIKASTSRPAELVKPEGGQDVPALKAAESDIELERPMSAEELKRLEIFTEMLGEIQEKRAMATKGGLVDEVFTDLPEARAPAMQRGERVPGRTEISPRVAASLRSRARRAFGRLLAEALLDPAKRTPLIRKTMEYLTPEQIDFVIKNGKLPKGFEFDHFLAVADFPEFAHRGDVGAALPKEVHREAAHGGDTTREREAATMLEPEAEIRPPFHPDTEGAEIEVAHQKSRERMIDEAMRTSGDIDQDILIFQRAELARMQAEAATIRRRKATAKNRKKLAALEKRIVDYRKAVETLETDIQQQAPAVGEAPPVETQATKDSVSPPAEGTAAAIELSRFRGDALDEPNPKTKQIVDDVLKSVAADETKTHVQMPDESKPGELLVTTKSGEEVNVKVVISDTMPSVEGKVPVASFKQTGANEYEVTVSSRVHNDMFERGISHEVTEIVHHHKKPGAATETDALQPGGYASDILATRKKSALSPHDYGRLAELEVLDKQVKQVKADGDQQRLAVLEDEAQRMLAHMGMVDETHAAKSRVELALDNVAHLPEVSKFISEQVDKARDNPFLKIVPEGYAERLDLLVARYLHAEATGDEARRLALLDQAVKYIGFAATETTAVYYPDVQRRVKKRVNLAQQTVGAKRSEMTRVLQELAKMANERKRSAAVVPDRMRSGGMLNPELLDPDNIAAIRRIHGDRRHFQEWIDFIIKHVGKEKKLVDINDQDVLKAIHVWSHGVRYGESGRIKSLVASAREADIKAVKGPVTARNDLILDASDNASVTGRRGKTIQQLVDDRSNNVNASQSSEWLGEAAAVKFAVKDFNVAENAITIGSGSGVPDLIFKLPSDSDRLIIIEAKGGESDLRARLDVNGTKMVQQGTYEYLESLAKSMQNSSDDKIVELGLKLEGALKDRSALKVDYYLVRQPFDKQGNLLAPEISQFDLSEQK